MPDCQIRSTHNSSIKNCLEKLDCRNSFSKRLGLQKTRNYKLLKTGRKANCLRNMSRIMYGDMILLASVTYTEGYVMLTP